MKKIILLPIVGTVMALGVSCGTTDTANMDLDNTRTSAYDVGIMSEGNNENYVGGTYSANRAKYYDGLYNNNSDYLYDFNARMNSRSYSNGNNYDSNYMNNSYLNNSDNEMYKDMSEVDFNNGLLTYENDYIPDSTTDTSTGTNVNTKALATNVLNSGGSSNSTIARYGYTDTENNNDDDGEVDEMNKVTYEIGNTYEEVKNATKELVKDVTEDTKDMMNTAKSKTKKVLNTPK